MEITSNDGHLQFLLDEPESELFRHIFSKIVEDYQLHPDELETKVSSIWYSSEENRKIKISKEEKEEWRRALYDFRGENCKKIEQWIKTLNQTSFPLVWNLTVDEAETFLTIINDHRLALAAKNDIGEHEMGQELGHGIASEKRMVLLQIHFLGWSMEQLLQEMCHFS